MGMQLSDLSSLLGQKVDIHLDLWAGALLLGQARTGSNIGRADTSDRGDLGNQEVDLHGAMAELLLLSFVKNVDENAKSHMLAHLFSENGGSTVKGPDLQFYDGNRTISIDAKSHDLSPNKIRFAINKSKHADLNGQCDYYFCVFSPPWGRHAFLAKLVPYADVTAWDAYALRKGKAPSRNLLLDDFMPKYGSSYNLSDLRTSKRFPEEEVRSRAFSPSFMAQFFSRFPAARRYIPSNSQMA